MKTRIVTAGIVVALIAGTSGKLYTNKLTVEENVYRLDPEKKVLVQAHQVMLETLNRTFEYTGTFAPFKEVMLIPQVPGEVKDVFFNEGDLVKQGKCLVQVDDELLQAQYASVAANYETAKRSLERYESASLSGGVSQLQLDNYRLNLKNAESQLKQLDKQIRLSRIEAPFTGTITFKDVEYGSVVANAPVARVTDLSKLKLEISVPEKEVGLFREGEWANISTDIYPGKIFRGKVLLVADRADAAHNYDVKILIENNNPAGILKAGMYGTVFLEKGISSQALLIPRSALLGSAKNPQVFVVENNAVALRSIQTGASNAESVEVTDGLKAGEMVVTGGQINLTEGSKVEIAKQ